MDLEKLVREWIYVQGIPLRWQFPNSLTFLLRSVADQARREGVKEAAHVLDQQPDAFSASGNRISGAIDRRLAVEVVNALATEDKEGKGSSE